MIRLPRLSRDTAYPSHNHSPPAYPRFTSALRGLAVLGSFRCGAYTGLHTARQRIMFALSCVIQLLRFAPPARIHPRLAMSRPTRSHPVYAFRHSRLATPGHKPISPVGTQPCRVTHALAVFFVWHGSHPCAAAYRSLVLDCKIKFSRFATKGCFTLLAYSPTCDVTYGYLAFSFPM